MVQGSKTIALAASVVAALLLALFPAAGHALSLCVCADGDVSLEAECRPHECCSESTEHAASADVESSSDCTEVPVLPESDTFKQIATPTAKRVTAPVLAAVPAPLPATVQLASPIDERKHHPRLTAPDCDVSVRSTVLLL